jgi:hypothetical protein
MNSDRFLIEEDGEVDQVYIPSELSRDATRWNDPDGAYFAHARIQFS